jgi:hypothetical protein
MSLLDATWTQHAYLRSSFITLALRLSCKFPETCSIPLDTLYSFLNLRGAALLCVYRPCADSLLWLIPLFCETFKPLNYMAFDCWANGRARLKVPSIAYDVFLHSFFPYATKEEFSNGGVYISDLKREFPFESSFCGYSTKFLALILEPTIQKVLVAFTCRLRNLRVAHSICYDLEHNQDKKVGQESWECTKYMFTAL